MFRNKAQSLCALIAIAAFAACTAHSQSSDPPPTDTTASAAEPSLTPLETVQYINQKITDQSRIPSGMDTGAATMWPGYFAIEQSTGTLWWVRGAQTSPSQWEIRYSSVQVDQLDPNLLELAVGHGNYEKITIKCKSAPDATGANPCWHNWVASWDDQSDSLSLGHFGDLAVARAADHEDQQVLNGYDVSVSPLRKQILLFDGKQKQLIDVEPTNPYPELEVYLGAADSDTAQRVERALKYLLKTMPASVTEKDPFGP
jgi:hypothetical protein